MKKIKFLFILLTSTAFSNETQAQSISGTNVGSISPAQDSYNQVTYSTSGKRPYWSFSAVAGRIYEFNLCTASGCSSNRVSIYSSAPSSSSPPSALVANGNGNGSCNNGSVIFQAPSSTTYYVGVSYGSAGAHTCTSFTLKYRYVLSSYTVCASATNANPVERMNSPISSCYYNYDDYYITYYPNFISGNNAVKLTFSAFNTESGWDYLYVYNGVGTGGSQVSGSPFSGSSIPSSITSSDNVYGALTLRFVSDDSTPSCLSGYTAAVTCTHVTTLPITLTDFQATQEDRKVNLLWTTASEQNNDYFTLEKSKDGINFTQFDMVKGAGNSSIFTNYSSIDYTPYDGLNYYRLKQTDYNGQYKYSNTIVVEYDESNSLKVLNLYPIPTNNFFSIDVYSPSKRTISLFMLDITGRVVYEEKKYINEGNTTININIIDLSNGIYSLKVMDSKGLIQNCKVVKQKD